MTLRRGFVCVVLAVSAVIGQLVVVNRLQLPGGAPDLALLAVLSIGLLEGPVTAMVVGFVTGLAGDLLGDHLVGRLALLFTLAGYAAGRLRREDSGVLLPIAVVVLAAALLSVVDNGISVLLGNGAGGVIGVLRAAGTSAVYDALLTPFLFPLARVLLDRSEGSS